MSLGKPRALRVRLVSSRTLMGNRSALRVPLVNFKTETAARHALLVQPVGTPRSQAHQLASSAVQEMHVRTRACPLSRVHPVRLKSVSTLPHAKCVRSVAFKRPTMQRLAMPVHVDGSKRIKAQLRALCAMRAFLPTCQLLQSAYNVRLAPGVQTQRSGQSCVHLGMFNRKQGVRHVRCASQGSFKTVPAPLLAKRAARATFSVSTARRCVLRVHLDSSRRKAIAHNACRAVQDGKYAPRQSLLAHPSLLNAVHVYVIVFVS